jgi:hypothetical protein
MNIINSRGLLAKTSRSKAGMTITCAVCRQSFDDNAVVAA